MSGTVDLFHSRRTYFAECAYWIVNDKISDVNEYVYKNQPTGTFYAKEISPQMNRENPQANKAMFDGNSITLQCDDDLTELRRSCLVKYNEEIWFVQDVQKVIHRKESQFNREIDYKYIISLRKGRFS